jgi:beta-lactamase superfamily II metal-dependent hydrolase
MLRPSVAAPLALAILALGLIAHPGVACAQSLEIYFIDVEGGQATLMVSPSGESILVDTGWPGDRDADRIAAAARTAGVGALDYLVITHYHDDHVGGMVELAERLSFSNVIIHGTGTESDSMAVGMAPTYREAMRITGAEEIVVRPGDVIPIEALNIEVVASHRDLIPEPLPGAGQPNPLCEGVQQRRADQSDNSASVAMMITFGEFRFLDIGDVTQDLEYELACPVNRIGEVDLYLTTHHGHGASNAPVLVQALGARVAIMNNGARKGGDPVVIQTVRTAPGLEDLWMLHFSEAAGAEGNVPEERIANPSDAPTATGNDTGYGIRVVAERDGSFTVTNARNGFSKAY